MAQSSEPKRTSRQRGKGRPFVKGQSGNPGGLPKSAREMREAFLLASPEALAKLLGLVRNSRSERIQREAADSILDRAGLKGYSLDPDKLALTDADGNSPRELVVRFVRPGDVDGSGDAK